MGFALLAVQRAAELMLRQTFVRTILLFVVVVVVRGVEGTPFVSSNYEYYDFDAAAPLQFMVSAGPPAVLGMRVGFRPTSFSSGSVPVNFTVQLLSPLPDDRSM